MEITAVVLHDSALAHYDVQVGNDGVCRAELARYSGRPDHTPPKEFTLRKEGRHWRGDVSDANLAEDVGYAIEMKVPINEVLLQARKRNGEHPAA